MNTNPNESARKWGLGLHLAAYVLANIIQIVVWAMFTPELHFWPIWSILAWGIGLAIHVWAVYAPRTKGHSAATP